VIGCIRDKREERKMPELKDGANWTDRGYADLAAQDRSLHFTEPGYEWPAEWDGMSCQHCGHRGIRWAVLASYDPTGEVRVFGSTCCSRIGFSVDQQRFRDFQRRMQRVRAQEETAERFPEAVAYLRQAEQVMLNAGSVRQMPHRFVQDMVERFNRRGVLTERQADALLRFKETEERLAARRAEEAARLAAAPPAPEGRAEVEGEVIRVKEHESVFGTSLKMTVQLDDGNKVWLTIPSGVRDGVYNALDLVGKRVRVKATFTRSDRDEHFAFGKRPSGTLVEMS
jgi:hypothetical protein